ncbi:four-carbon acid sugar kinase family protein [Azospirillum sp. RWY-5-1]|uniref:3-oxo-tetronate kinase n=1 Tax=Azospirillum oleiclasticum TaxID=2735135 RepID=A0ABX2T703_9PROT|nr:3-oxo-tetronate kinase [Azospirillum oleiclasticum]NYZ12814.1 four-carbon acid sugar kinase family protein [Azospirillum oleiclasticum]NYZ19974.1 four-carbon acid sugar kinase family protein [Azospirillum oleiclasticum]
MTGRLLLGCVADDYTGASDLANTLAKSGLRTVQTIGVDGLALAPDDAEAIVVALKSRSIEPEDAVRLSVEAWRHLKERGARQCYFKYCSTFDSTERGNIGPVTDALMAETGATMAVACPTFPENGRTVYQGHLFVWAQPLDESPLRDHPLNPMRDANLVRVLQAQSGTRVGLVPWQDVAAGGQAIRARLAALQGQGIGAAIVDAITLDDLTVIGAACHDHPLVTGASGLAAGLAANFIKAGAAAGQGSTDLPPVAGPEVLIAGSCSPATLAQVERAAARYPVIRLDVDAVLSGRDEVARVAAEARGHLGERPMLIVSSATPDDLRRVQETHGRDAAGRAVEQALAAVAAALAGAGARRFVVAGGETSGAVVDALGVQALRIGPEIAPGVPAMVGLGERAFALALKSGNFGGPDFFADALGVMP